MDNKLVLGIILICSNEGTINHSPFRRKLPVVFLENDCANESEMKMTTAVLFLSAKEGLVICQRLSCQTGSSNCV